MSAREHCLLRQQSGDYFSCNVDLGQTTNDEPDANSHFAKHRGNLDQEDFGQYLNEPISVATVCQPMTSWIPRYYYAKKSDEYSGPSAGYGHNGQAMLAHPHHPTQFINGCYPVTVPDHRYPQAAFTIPFQETMEGQHRQSHVNVPPTQGWPPASVLPDCS